MLQRAPLQAENHVERSRNVKKLLKKRAKLTIPHHRYHLVQSYQPDRAMKIEMVVVAWSSAKGASSGLAATSTLEAQAVDR